MSDDTFLLPGDDPGKRQDDKDDNPAAELIRKKVEAAYIDEPDVAIEAEEVKEVAKDTKLTKHQKFIYEITSSGKSLEDVQVAWHDYYAGLTDVEKHQVWHEFYAAQAATSKHPYADKPEETAEKRSSESEVNLPKPLATVTRTLADIRDNALRTVPKKRKTQHKGPLHSLAFGLGIGAIVVFFLLFSFFNERFIAPFIQPSRSLSSVPLISDGGTVSSEPEVIIPKINVEIPVVYGVSTIDDNAIEAALEQGVVHYADTANPGQNGNVVIVGHSSNNIFNKGKYKFAFVLLSRLEPGDTFYLQKDGKRYTYQVYQKKIVKPGDTSVLGLTDKKATATLVTCDPPGTSINRLVITAEQINPDSSANSAGPSQNTLATQTKIIPGNSESLWGRFVKFIER